MIRCLKKYVFTVFAACALSLLTIGVSSAEIGMQSPSMPENRFAFPDTTGGLSLSSYDSPNLFKRKSSYIKYEFKIDSVRTRIIGKCNIFYHYFARDIVYNLEEYKKNRYEKDVRAAFRSAVKKVIFATSTTSGDGALKIEIPWRVRSKTFRKIFGGDRVGLRVSGNITINGGLRRQKSDQNYTTQNDQANYSFRIDQTQRFTIEGKVGDKVSVKVDQDSERMFDFENAIKLEYTGEEDEIIQKIEAGNVGLSLTGTQLASFSSTHKGLFGLKTESRLGPLKVTTIASVEKGQKNKRSLTGGAEETTNTIQSKNYIKNKYFFIDVVYRNNYRYFTSVFQHVYVSNYQIKNIKVYKSVPNTASSSTTRKEGWALYNPNDNFPSASDQNNYQGYFVEMLENEYEVDYNTGIISLTYSLSDETALACAYITSDNDTIGNYVVPAGDIKLKLIRPNNPQPTDSTWKYQLQNRYSFNAYNVQKEGFELKVFFDNPEAGSDVETQPVGDDENLPYIQILGLDNRNTSGSNIPDGVVDDNGLISWAKGEIELPGLRPFDPDSSKGGGYFIDSVFVERKLDSTYYVPAIYDSSDNFTPPSYYYFSVKHKSVSASFNLGFNVLEGSEEVSLNGVTQKKGSDYTIDYMTGNLIILNPTASSASANLEVLWESGEMFQLDKKTLLGVRGEYDLWNEQSFLGTTALYLNEKPLEERVKVGNEPTRNFVIDGNSRMIFETKELTNFLDMIPFLEADAPSQISIEGEIARVYPNPNSLNNPATGDYNGVAYIDDFESIKRVTSLGIMRKNWRIGSIPGGTNYSTQTNELKNLARGKLLWYNPFDQVPIKQIWPERETNAQTASEVHVLNLDFDPVEDLETLSGGVYDNDESWASVQRALSAGYADQTKAKFLEIWLKDVGDLDCKLNIDFGKVSEDAIPNGILNNEDRFIEGLTYGDGLLDSDEDVGLDMMANDDSVAIAAKTTWETYFPERTSWDFWDIDKDSTKDDWEPWSDDGYNYSQSNKNDYSHINGTEGNLTDEGERLPDTEDLNNNGSLENTESFFRCAFDVPTSPLDTLIDGINPDGWRLVRFPLKYAQPINNPSWNQVQYVRIWITGADQPVQLQIASVELVGNEWEEVRDTTATGAQNEKLEISVINTFDNQSYVGNQPPGVRGIRDPITNVLSREQSLVLKINKLDKIDVLVQRTFYSPMNFLEYDSLKMFVRGGGVDLLSFEDYDLDMYFRFGADTSSNYYELYQPLKPGWHKDNEIRINLEQIPTIKLERDALNAGMIDPENTLTKVSPTDPTVGYRIIGDDSLVVKGEPSLSAVKQLTIGLHNRSLTTYTKDDNLEVWLDELRLSNVKKDPGTAYRASADISFSDLGRFHIETSNRDPDFHSLEQRLGTGSGSSTQGMTGNFALDRFFPPTLGLRLPVNGNYNRSTTTPKYYPGSDILLDTGDQAAIDTVKTFDERKGWSISFSRGIKSTNPLLKYSVDNLSGGYDYSDSYATSPTNIFSKSKSHSANLAYGLTFGRDKSFGLFGWAKNIPLLKKLKDTQFTYMPTRIQANISGTESMSESLTRTGSSSNNRTFGITRTFATGYRPFNVMNFDITRTHRSDMLNKGWEELANGDVGKDNNINQSFNASYAPTVLNWLTHDVNYTGTYQWNWGSGYSPTQKSIQSNKTVSTSWNLKTSQIFPSKTTKRRGTGKVGGKTSKTPGGDKKEEEKKLDLLKPVKFAFSKLNDVKFDYTHTRNLSTPAVEGQPGWLYQLGLSKNPEIGQVSESGINTTGNESYSDDYKIKSGLNIISNLRTTFDHSYNTSESRGVNKTGQFTQTSFYTFSDKGKVNDFPFVNLSLRLTGLEKLALFSDYAQTVSLESAYSGKTKTDWENEKSNEKKNTYDKNLSPLLGINVSWKGGISSNLQFKKTSTLTEPLNLSKTRSTNNTISLTGNYTRKTGFKVPIPIWPFKNKRFNNNTTFSLTFSSSNRVEETMALEATKFTATNNTKQWSVMPKIDYTFSNTVTGGIHFEMGSTENKLTGKTSFHEFGFNVNIAIRGR